MKARLFICSLFLCMIAATVQAQSADKITEIMQTPVCTTGQVAYLSAVWLNLLPEDADEVQAASVLSENNIFVTQDASAPIRMDELALICLRTWNIPGGLLYTLTGNKRYAFKELQFLTAIEPTADPASHISGLAALQLINICEDIAGGLYE